MLEIDGVGSKVDFVGNVVLDISSLFDILLGLVVNVLFK